MTAQSTDDKQILILCLQIQLAELTRGHNSVYMYMPPLSPSQITHSPPSGGNVSAPSQFTEYTSNLLEND